MVLQISFPTLSLNSGDFQIIKINLSATRLYVSLFYFDLTKKHQIPEATPINNLLTLCLQCWDWPQWDIHGTRLFAAAGPP